jgi:hypothetical protein
MDWDASLNLNIVVGGVDSGSAIGDTAKKTAPKKKLSKYDKRRAARRRAPQQKGSAVAATSVLPISSRPVLTTRTKDDDDALDNSTQSTNAEHDATAAAVTTQSAVTAVQSAVSSALALPHNNKSSNNDTNLTEALSKDIDDDATASESSYSLNSTSRKPVVTSARQAESLDSQPTTPTAAAATAAARVVVGHVKRTTSTTSMVTQPHQPLPSRVLSNPILKRSNKIKSSTPRTWRNFTLDRSNWIDGPEFAPYRLIVERQRQHTRRTMSLPYRNRGTNWACPRACSSLSRKHCPCNAFNRTPLPRYYRPILTVPIVHCTNNWFGQNLDLSLAQGQLPAVPMSCSTRGQSPAQSPELQHCNSNCYY